ncbi:ATPase domain-containing protein [Variovorax sp. J22R133]|uniref:ATPase domain-containing protein n=1 Tax=Variovorax brevis TaxID=3053503 RepID=UPI0025755EF0|nr:ATPase domain-containing protein [Variovorax sp. J22R133]MDM0117645.1 ATPase domain-containing protein [Variovorax sp. J22R133]
MNDKVEIRRLPTGVPGLDAVLGGGLAEFSFNLIAGAPGSGKTTLAHQIMFSLAKPDRRALFFTVLGEPPLKMLRYQQQYSFFDASKVNDSIRFVNLADDVMTGNFERVLARITEEVELFEPALVLVDSFRSVVQATKGLGNGMDLQQFIQRLGVHLTTWQATTFLIGEYMAPETESNPIFTVADGILWLAQSVDRNSMVRKIQVTKMRGHATIPGLHTFRISGDGVHIFPRTIARTGQAPAAGPLGGDPVAPLRLSMGIPVLDELMCGGLPAGYSLLVAGPSGSGKSQLAAAFLAAGAQAGEKGVIAAFEKSPGLARTLLLDKLIADGDVSVVDTRTLDLSIDETLYALTELIGRTGATRVVIDSLSGFELALAPTFREDFRESLHRMVAVLTGMGAAVLMISELEDRYTDLRFSPYGAAFLTDAIIVQRYVELQGEIKRVMAVVKLRNSAHSHELRLFEITDTGIAIGERKPEMNALLTGHPRLAATMPVWKADPP